VARRFEVRGEAAGVVLVDSYDHLPTEVAAALAAARAGGWNRVVCCFQPHRFSRTEALGRTFADCFDGADLLVVTDVYPAGEAPRPGITGKIVVDAVLDAHPWKAVAWLPSLDDVVTYLGNALRPGDLCLTLGAGDLTTIPDRVVAGLGARRR
jgi:UDP-N-acetylmuramate--alanine ligase